jgi:hypothetical protein
VADDDASLAAEPGEATDDRGIVREPAVAVQLLEPGKEIVDVVERVRPLRVTRDERDLPRGQLAVDVAGQCLALLLQARDFLGDVDRRIVLHEAQLLDLRFQLGDRLLEFEKCRFHDAAMIPEHRCASPSAYRAWKGAIGTRSLY